MLSLHLPAASRDSAAVDDGFAPNAFIRIGNDGQVVLTMPYVEMGQGTYTSIPMLIAEELEVELNQVLVSFGDGEKTRRVIERIQLNGECWCGETVWQGRVAMRISVSSWATTGDDVERSLQAILRAARD